MKSNYKKLPTVKLRADGLRHAIKSWRPGYFLEFGAGTGLLTTLFLDYGYTGVCYDLNSYNVALINENLAEYKNKILATDNLEEISTKSFDYIFAFDVIEHIEQDEATLKLWLSYLKPNGKVLISVPAHMKKFGEKDVIMGHYRRYEKRVIENLLMNSGCKNVKIICYGFPLLNVTGFVIDILYKLMRKGEQYRNLSCTERSIKSGIETPGIARQLSFLFNDVIIFPFKMIQRLFFKKDIGAAYIVSAEYPGPK
jgi:SAM-dependent methyltransferase